MSNMLTGPLEAAADQLEVAAEARGLCVIRTTLEDPEYAPFGPFIDHKIESLIDLVVLLQLRALQIIRVVVDAAHYGCTDAATLRSGQCSDLYIGFCLEGQQFWATCSAGWKPSLGTVVRGTEPECSGASTAFARPALSTPMEESDIAKVVHHALNHQSLQGISAFPPAELRQTVDRNLTAIAGEVDVALPSRMYRRVIAQDVVRGVALVQKSACADVESQIDYWADKLNADACFLQPTATERDVYCRAVLASHLGFPPNKSLCEQVRRFADAKRSPRCHV